MTGNVLRTVNEQQQLFGVPARQIATDWAREMLALAPGKALILDTETCDLNGEVIELAIIDTNNNTFYNRRFKPITAIQPGAFRVHGISAVTLAHEPSFASEYPIIKRIIDKAQVVLIYNNTFDLGCLAVTCKLHGVPDLSIQTACIMRWYAQWYGERGRNGYRWQKLTGGDHTALGDARAALHLLRTMAGEVEGKPEKGSFRGFMPMGNDEL